MGKKIWQVKINVVKKTILKISRLGRYNAFMVLPEIIIKGKSFKKGRMRIWFSADKRIIPLIIETKAFALGAICATLIKMQDPKQ